MSTTPLLRLRWLFGLWILLAVTTFVPPATFAYDGQNPPTVTYDGSGEWAFVYDARFGHTQGGKENGAIEDRVRFVNFPGFLAAKSELNILGKGSTADLAKGTTLPRNLREQLALEQAAANPAAGTRLPINMTDPRWPGSQGWEKWQQVIKPGGDPINVHYLRNPATGQIDDFKIVLP